MSPLKARKTALKLLENVESQLNDSRDLEGTFKDINKSDDDFSEPIGSSDESQSSNSNKFEQKTVIQVEL